MVEREKTRQIDGIKSSRESMQSNKQGMTAISLLSWLNALFCYLRVGSFGHCSWPTIEFVADMDTSGGRQKYSDRVGHDQLKADTQILHLTS